MQVRRAVDGHINNKRDIFLLIILAAILALSCVLFLLINSHGDFGFILAFRSKKLILLLLIAYSIGVSTLLFQTLTNNPILTPSILGFDSLYILLQTFLVFILGAIGYSQLSPLFKFGAESILMIVASLLLFKLLNKQNALHDDLGRMILVGVIFGVLFRSLNQIIQRMLDPMQFAVTQQAAFAEFDTVKEPIIWLVLALNIISVFFIWRLRFALDVVALGKAKAIGLGLDYQRFSVFILTWIALLLASATALVGAVGFFGLLVCAIGNFLVSSYRHEFRLPVVVLISAITLVLGQTIFEHVLKLHAVLSVVIEFAGGIVFLMMLIKSRK